MIDETAWNQMTDKEKLKLCNWIQKGFGAGYLDEDDWKLLFNFLLNRVQGGSR